MIPVLVTIAAASAIAVGRAAWRARQRLIAMPPSAFGIVGGCHTSAPFLEGGFEPRMTYGEALQILDLPPAPTRDQLTSNHRRIMLSNHPDRGGSTYMALKINEARLVVRERLR